MFCEPFGKHTDHGYKLKNAMIVGTLFLKIFLKIFVK